MKSKTKKNWSRTFRIGLVSVKIIKRGRNENKFTITFEHDAPPQRMMFKHCTEEFIQLIAKELMAQNKDGVNSKSFADISKSILYSVEIYPDPKSKRAIGSAKFKQMLIDAFANILPDVKK